MGTIYTVIQVIFKIFSRCIKLQTFDKQYAVFKCTLFNGICVMLMYCAEDDSSTVIITLSSNSKPR